MIDLLLDERKRRFKDALMRVLEGRTQLELGKLLGISPTNISNYKALTQFPTNPVIEAMARLEGVEVSKYMDYLYGRASLENTPRSIESQIPEMSIDRKLDLIERMVKSIRSDN